MVESHLPVGGAQGAESPDCWFADTRVPATSAPRSTGSGFSLMVVCGFRAYCAWMTVTNAADDARAAVAARREQLDEVLRRYGASNPRLFGSVACGDATTGSDIDVLVDLDPAGGNPLMRLAGLSEEFRRVLGVDVDVVAAELLRDGVAEAALTDAVAS